MNFLKVLKNLILFPFYAIIKIVKLLTIRNFIKLILSVRDILSFVVLLLSYLLMSSVLNLTASRYFPNFLGKLIFTPVSKIYEIIVSVNRYSEQSINRINLIELAIRNMRFKKSRTFITIGGMSIGIAAIVFLVSLGYGLQKMVTSRVARLDEMKQADVITQPGSNIKINDKTINDFNQFENIKHTLPLIALVGKVNYNNSVSDMAVYGVTSEYLMQSAIKPIQGKIFESNDLASSLSKDFDNEIEKEGKVAGVTDSEEPVKMYQPIAGVGFAIFPEEWIKVRKSPSISSEILGYTKRDELGQSGYQIWGGSYADNKNGISGVNENGDPMGKWIKADFFIWKKNGTEYEPVKIDNDQEKILGYIAQIDKIKIQNTYEIKDVYGQVLGENTSVDQDKSVITLEEEHLARTTMSEAVSSTFNSVVAGTTESEKTEFENIVEINGEIVFLENNLGEKDKVKKISLADNALKEAVVNRAMLKLLGVPEEEAVGKNFDVTFIVPSTLVDLSDEKIESNTTSYTIVGVIPQDDAPFFYAPFFDLRSLGITNYSQIKIVSDDQNELETVRTKIEAMGFLTSSVVDTVEQINKLFSTARTVLALIGTVALAVAALGMFNTLTVSLLERIREIGLMKAMGMKSYEVKELFLTESMIMGFFGGVLGIGMGYLAGKLLSLLLTALAINSGLGIIDVSYVPPSIIFIVLGLSIFVGLITGLYPAKRATDISALNALRYE